MMPWPVTVRRIVDFCTVTSVVPEGRGDREREVEVVHPAQRIVAGEGELRAGPALVAAHVFNGVGEHHRQPRGDEQRDEHDGPGQRRQPMRHQKTSD